MSLAGSPPVAESQVFLGSVETYLRDLIDAERRWMGADDGPVSGAPAAVGPARQHTRDLYVDLHTAVGGGKRLRPTFCYWGYVGASGRTPGPDVVRMSAALELLHTFAVVHDDVMDGSPTRRGRPSVHADLSERHAREGWRGERRRFAEGGAILIGDLAFAMAQRLAAEFPRQARAVWHRMCAELVVGQHLDVRGSAAGERDVGYAVSVATLKSAGYTVVHPLHLGAALADRSDKSALTDCYAAYGYALGSAFQLRDDLLGVFGDAEVTGKPVGEDLREGRPTRLLAVAAERATPAERRLIERAGAGDLTEAEVGQLTAVCLRTGADAEVEQQIKLAVEQAQLAVVEAPIHPPAATVLRSLAENAAWRRR
jgi:geranylgeranyl diphosphate synthase, type I